MACGCIDKVEQNTLNFLKEKHKDRTYEDVSGWGSTGLKNVGFSLCENGGRMVYFEYKSQYTFIKVNGQTSSLKTENISLYPTYCPFCGVKLT